MNNVVLFEETLFFDDLASMAQSSVGCSCAWSRFHVNFQSVFHMKKIKKIKAILSENLENN